jgi:hypothetical protein
MRRTGVLTLTLTLTLTLVGVLGVSACTSGPPPKTAGTTQRAIASSPTPAAPTGPVPVLTALEVQDVLDDYAAGAQRAEPHRSVKGTRKIQTGPLLAATLAEYRYDKGAGRKPFRALDLTTDENYVPALSSYPHWFLSKSSVFGGSNPQAYISLFEQQRANGPWRKALEIWAGSNDLSPSGGAAGVAEAATAAQNHQAKSAVQALANYLQTGHAATKLRDTRLAQDMRKRFKKDAKHLAQGATAKVSCSTPHGSKLRALSTASGTEFVASLHCDAIYRAKPNFVLSIRAKAKGLTNHRSNLHTIVDRYLVQAAFRLDHQGNAKVIGKSWELFDITTH